MMDIIKLTNDLINNPYNQSNIFDILRSNNANRFYKTFATKDYGQFRKSISNKDLWPHADEIFSLPAQPIK